MEEPHHDAAPSLEKPAAIEAKPKQPFSWRDFYEKNYKKLMLIPFGLLLIALVLIGYTLATTGDFINRDISLKGGLTFTIPLEEGIDAAALEEYLQDQFPVNELAVRSLRSGAKKSGIIIDSDIDGTKKENVDKLLAAFSYSTNVPLQEGQYTLEFIGSSLGSSFFRETIVALLFSFILMGIVVILYFRSFIPSVAVLLAAFSDIIITLAIINLLGIKIGTAGIAAFLMLIGYSVDTDILLTSRVLKKKGSTVTDSTISAFKTGILMTSTALAAIIVALVISKSEIVTQIMTVLSIGLIVDVVNTWIQNAGILRWYLERKVKTNEQI